MKRFFLAKWRFAVCYGTLLMAAFSWALLDTFVIPHREALVAKARSAAERVRETLAPDAAQAEPEVTQTSYRDKNVSVGIQTLRLYDTDCYVAEVALSDPAYLKTALAQDTFGRNVTQTVSDMAAEAGAILAINGDYYGARRRGWCVRNGVVYRQSSAGEATDLLLIDANGDFATLSDRDMTPEQALEMWQVLCFGPALVTQGQVAVSEGQEVGRAKASNPRTAIGQIGQNHYVFVVTDGRTEQSAGLSLWQLAELMQSLGCRTAYNLDGGGSSTMVFMGEVVNNPTGNGHTITQREVSDIVCIAL